MGILRIQDTKLYRELRSRESDTADMYAGILSPVIKDMEAFLQYIKRFFPEYPDHGLQHSLRIIGYISEILSEKEIKELSETEIFILILSALFHDTGMTVHDDLNSGESREHHHEFSEIVIDSYFQEKMNLLGNADRIKSVVVFACKGHGLKISELYMNKNFCKQDRIENDLVRYSLVAILLRIGDLMDIDSNRVNEFVMKSFYDDYSEISLEHNLRSLNVQIYNYSPEEINIEVRADTPLQYLIWSKWLAYLEEEIVQANTCLKKYNFFFPRPKINILHNEKDYEVEDIRFEIDEKGGIFNIISQSIYTDEKDFIRELIQNAIDGSLGVIYQNSAIILKHGSPRAWNAEQYCSDIFVGYSEKEAEFILIDFGIGMNSTDIKKFLFKVSSTGYKEWGNREFEFPCIASFGIGFISCLINASYIELFSKKDHQDGCKITLEEGINLAFIQSCEVKDFHGTAIKLILKHKFSYEDIEKYIHETFVYPSINIGCFNLDDIRKVSGEFCSEDELKVIENDFYKYPSLLKRIDLKIKGIKFSGMYKTVTEAESDVFNLIDWIAKNAEYNAKISDKKKFVIFREKISKLSEYGQKLKRVLGISFPLNKNTVSQKDLFNYPDEYIRKLSNYRAKLVEIRQELAEEQKKYSIDSYIIKTNKICDSNRLWKYMIVFLNEDLNVCDIKIENSEIDLLHKTGILFIRQYIEDYDIGVELEAINGFLFTGGRIVQQINKFYQRVQKDEINRTERSVIIGNVGGVENIRDSLEEDYDYQLNSLDDEGFLGYNYNGRYELAREYEDFFESIYICKNNILHLSNQSISDIERGFGDEKKEQDSSDITNILWDKYNFDLNYPELWGQLQYVLRDYQSAYFQDGIKTKFNLESIIPVGFFKIRCNCTFNARMALNVTRHKPSELRTDIETWCDQVGFKIQESIIGEIRKSLDAFNLDVDFLELLNHYSSDYFSVLNKIHFKKLV